MTTTTATAPRVRIVDGMAVRDLPDGGQRRVRVTRDIYPEEPERGHGMWNEGVSLVRVSDGYHGMDLDEHDGLARVLNRVNRDGRYWWVERCDPRHTEASNRMWDADKTVEQNWMRTEHDLRGEDRAHEFIARYLRAFWGVQYAELHHHTGYSQSDWADIWVIAEGIEDGADPEAIARGTWEEWDAWAKGDVYRIEVETRTVLAAMEAGDDEDGWECDDYGITYYGDDSAREGIAVELECDLKDVPPVWNLVTD